MPNPTPLTPIIYAKMLSSGGNLTPETLVIITGELTEDQAAQVRDNIGAVSADDIGTVFTIKGSVATVADLPATGNSIGDVYYVESVSAGYVWITSTAHPDGYWEELGEPIDLSAYQLKPTITNVSGTTPTITPVDNTIYKCGTLTSLTITDPPGTGSYVIKFTSGSIATTTTIPASVVFPEAFAAEANTRYEINVEDGYAVVVGWPTT